MEDLSVSPGLLVGGGGLETEVLGPDGSFPSPLLCVTMVGGAAEADRLMGGFGGGGLGLGLTFAGVGALPTCPRFNAAIRA